MTSTIQTLASLAALDAEAFTYQVTGMCVVFCCLGFLCVLLTISGSVAQRLDARRKAQAEAARAALAAAAPAPAPAPAPVTAPVATAPSPAEVATMAAGIYDATRSSITPEIVAAIAAAVKVTLGTEARILSITPVSADYARGGRSAIMNSHFPVRG